jgi:ABC-type multidrug transport system fused ATPase/permease subunit
MPVTDQTPKNDFAFWKTLWEYVRPHRAKLYITIVCSIIVGVAVAIQPLVIKFIIDNGITRANASPKQKLLYSLLFIGIYFAVSGIRVSVWTVGYRRLINTIQQLLFAIRSRFFRHVHALCFRFHDSVSSGELFNYIMGSPINQLKMFLRQFVLQVPYQVVAWAVAMVALFSFDPLMTLIFVVTVVTVVRLNMRSKRIIRNISADFMQHESDASKYVADMLRGSREIKIHAIGDRVSGRFDDKIGVIRDKEEYLLRRQQIERIKPEAIQYVGVGIIYIAGAYSCIYRDLTVGELMGFVNAVGRLMGPLLHLFQLNLIRANAEAGLERITRILNTQTTVPEAEAANRITIQDAEARARAQGEPFVEFDAVQFSYHQGEQYTNVLDSLSCRIGHDESVGLVGPSGSGKTTFIRLLLRFYDPQAGQVRLHGKDIREFVKDDVRASFGVVSQSPFVFQTTILENVRVANPSASRDEVRRAMRIAGVEDFLQELPQGEDTQVGEDGYGLSGGQKQRVAIARAILSNPRYFIFDEATSSLDNQSEKKIQHAMESLMREHAMIIIAHRLSTVRNLGRILVFDKGRIVQDGDYDTLATRPGLFKDLVAYGL